MLQYDLSLDKYWVTHHGYFILATIFSLGMGITNEKLIFYHGVSKVNVDKKISMIEYKNRMVYDCFNNNFTSDFVSSTLNITPITIDGRPIQHKRSRYTPYLLPDTIYFAPENSAINFDTLSDSPKLLLLTSDYPNHHHFMKKY